VRSDRGTLSPHDGRPSGNVTLDEIIERIRKLMALANVQQCETVDVLIANDPRKRP
jgi:hypothetical protein